ncbi:MAG TPA: hypothetical protein VIM85_12600 [Pseudomonadales bacterium]
MNRLYLAASNAELAKAVTEELLRLPIPKKRIQIVAEDLQLLREKQLPVASLFNRTNIPQAFERYTLLGLLLGTLLSLLLIMIAPGGKPFSSLMFAEVVLVMALAGAAAGFLIGAFQDNHHIKEYRSRLDRSECIIELKLDAKESSLVKNRLRQNHLKVDILREDLDVCHRTISERTVKAL